MIQKINKFEQDKLTGFTPSYCDRDYFNQTGNPPQQSYSTNPPGVNPSMVQFLASNGVLIAGGDPLNTSLSTKQYANNNFGNFWKLVFPLGTNDCDLQAAITNITAKINQLSAFAAPGNANKWVQANISQGGGCPGCQGDAAAYIMTSISTLKTILQQYQNQYNSNVTKGGGCSNGVITSEWNAWVASQNNAAQQLSTQNAANLQAESNAVPAAEAAAAASKVIANQGAANAQIQGTAAGTAAQNYTAAATSLTPTTMVLYAVIGIAVIGGAIYFMKKSPAAK